MGREREAEGLGGDCPPDLKYEDVRRCVQVESGHAIQAFVLISV